MTNSPDLVLAGKPRATGGIYVAPVTVTAPTDAATALPSGFGSLGLVGPDGVTRSIDKTTQDWRQWSGSTYRVITTEHSVVYKLTLVESANIAVLREVFGARNVSEADGVITVKITGDDLPPRAWSLEMIDGQDALREFIPRGQITTAAAEVTFSAEDPVGFEIEITALDPGDGVKAVTLIEKDGFAEAA